MQPLLHLLVKLQYDSLIGFIAVLLRQPVDIGALRQLGRQPRHLALPPRQRVLQGCSQARRQAVRPSSAACGCTHGGTLAGSRNSAGPL